MTSGAPAEAFNTCRRVSARLWRTVPSIALAKFEVHNRPLGPFPIIAAAPYFGDGENSRRSERAAKAQAKARARSGQAFEEGPGAAHARQGGAAGAAADGADTRRLAQSRHRPGNRGTGLADRIEAAAGQFLRPPRRFLRRAPGAQVDGAGIGRGAADALQEYAAGRTRSRPGEGARHPRRR